MRLKATTAVFGACCTALLLLDQVSKWLVIRSLAEERDTLSVIDGLLLLEHTRNTGGAFSMLEGQRALFGWMTLVAVGVLVYLLRQLGSDRGGLWQAAALGIIAGGTLGNGLDRLLLGSVTDFIRVYTSHPALAQWLVSLSGSSAGPTFNLADVALVVGVLLSAVAAARFPEDRSDSGADTLPRRDQGLTSS